MIVLRSGQKVGRVRVTSVNATDSEAVIVDTGKGIRPEDKLVSVFALPGISVSSTGVARASLSVAASWTSVFTQSASLT
jgi:hypothetical protein